MADTLTVAQEIEGWVLDAVHKGNTVTMEAFKVFTDAVKPVTAVLPNLAPPLAVDFVEKLAASERKFAEDMLQLTTRIIPAPPKTATK